MLQKKYVATLTLTYQYIMAPLQKQHLYMASDVSSGLVASNILLVFTEKFLHKEHHGTGHSYPPYVKQTLFLNGIRHYLKSNLKSNLKARKRQFWNIRN